MPKIILGTKNNGIKLKERISTMSKKKKSLRGYFLIKNKQILAFTHLRHFLKLKCKNIQEQQLFFKIKREI